VTKQVNRLRLFHFRKAGGTSLRSFVRELAKHYSIDSSVAEGHSLDASDYFEAAATELHLTSLRDPIARIKSSYLFEGRWPQQDLVRSTADAVPFDVWVNKVRSKPPSSFLWVCVSNYYVKSLIGYPAIGGEKIGRSELDLAKQVLEKFDIVLICEWMSRPQTNDYLAAMLNHAMPVPHKRYPTAVANPVLDLDEIFDDVSIRQLVADNSIDAELYSFACDLAESRMRKPYAVNEFSFGDTQELGRLDLVSVGHGSDTEVDRAPLAANRRWTLLGRLRETLRQRR
jgi:hypothetical protein